MISGELGFLSRKVASQDIILVAVTGAPRPQVLRATVEQILSARKGVEADCLGGEIEFIQSPGHWGDPSLQPGDRALVFVSMISGNLYEDAWRGHMVIEEMEGENYAIFPLKELWHSEDIPDAIKKHSRQDPKRQYATAILFNALKDYLLDLVGKTDAGAAKI
jgi:hypothetical protein